MDVERRGKLELTDVTFLDDAHLLRVIDKMVSRMGRRIDESSPMVDARLPDGSRINAIIPPSAIDGPLLSIRRFAVNPLQVKDLIGLSTLTDEMAQLLDAMVRAKLNILISGGTGSGKTTLLNILSGFIPADERVVTIEDAAELQLRPAARAAPGDAPCQYRGPWRDHPARAGQERAADAARPDHPGRSTRRGGAGHAPRDEHRPRGLAGHHPRQHAA